LLGCTNSFDVVLKPTTLPVTVVTGPTTISAVTVPIDRTADMVSRPNEIPIEIEAKSVAVPSSRPSTPPRLALIPALSEPKMFASLLAVNLAAPADSPSTTPTTPTPQPGSASQPASSTPPTSTIQPSEEPQTSPDDDKLCQIVCWVVGGMITLFLLIFIIFASVDWWNRRPNGQWPPGGLGMSRKVVFCYEFSFLISLLLTALLYLYFRYFHTAWVSTWLPNNLGPFPIGVPWYGALGAALFSLVGVSDHRQDWDFHFWPWYLARPFVGAGLAILSVLMLMAGILAVGSTPTAQSSSAVPITGNLLYYLVAFLVGYREETFRDMLKRLTNVFLGDTTTGGGPVIQSIDPPNIPNLAATPIVVTGLNLAKTKLVTMGDSKVTYTVTPDAKLHLTTPQLPVGSASLVVVTDDGMANYNCNVT
jgi:hypothetical protein